MIDKMNKIFIVITIMVSLNSCTKDSFNIEGPKRISKYEVFDNFGNSNYIRKFVYDEHGNITQSNDSSEQSDGNFRVHRRTNITYYTNRIVLIKQSKTLEETWKNERKFEYLTDDNFITSIIESYYKDNKWMTINPITINYKNGKIESWKESKILYECEYKDGLVTKLHQYDVEKANEKVLIKQSNFLFENKKCIGYEVQLVKKGVFELDYKQTYSYLNNNIDKIASLSRQTSYWSEFARTFYKYDDHSNMIELKNDGFTIIYKYEMGDGNSWLTDFSTRSIISLIKGQPNYSYYYK